jgi:hypothetical protein
LLQVFNSFQTKALELNTSLLEAKKTTQEVSMEKKYQDFKKAVDLIINKSTELEKIIDSGQLVISEDLKEKLTKIQELKAKAQNKNGVYQKIKQQKAQKEQELNILKSSIFSKYKELDKGDLEDILIDQDNAIKDNNEKNNEKLQRAKKRLAKDIDKEEVDQLCQLQSEITQLELQLNQNLENSTKELTQIINHITNNYGTNITGTVNISGGQTIMGGQNQGVNQTNNNNPLISGGDFTNATFSGDAFSSNNLEKYSSKEKKDNKKRAKRTS